MTHSDIDRGFEKTGAELRENADVERAAGADIDDIEALADGAADTGWVDAMFDRLMSENNADYPFTVEEDKRLVEAEIARIENVASRIDPDLIDNVIDVTRLSALFERRADLKGGGR